MRIIKDLKNILSKVVFSISLACTELYSILFKRIDMLEVEVAAVRVLLESNMDRLDYSSDNLDNTVDRAIQFYNKANLYIGELYEIKKDIEVIHVQTEAIRDKLDEDPPPVNEDDKPVILDEEKAVETVNEIASEVNKEIDAKVEANKKLMEEAAQSLDSSMNKVEAVKNELDNLKNELEQANKELRDMQETLKQEAARGEPGNYTIGGNTLVNADTAYGKTIDIINKIGHVMAGIPESRPVSRDEAIVYEQVRSEFGNVSAGEAANMARDFEDTKNILETQGREAAIEHAKETIENAVGVSRTEQSLERLAETYVDAIQDRIDIDNASAGVSAAAERVQELAEQVSQEQEKYKEALEQVKEDYDKYIDVSTTASADAYGRLDEAESYDGSEGGGGGESDGPRENPRDNTSGESRAERERERAEREKREMEERAEKYFKEYLDEFGSFD